MRLPSRIPRSNLVCRPHRPLRQLHGVGGRRRWRPARSFWQRLVHVILTFDADGLEDAARPADLHRPRGSIAVNLIVFVETGLLLGFFLPGDSLLVTVGLIAAGPAQWNLPLILTTVSLSAILGDTVGYSIGYKTGPMIFNREKSLFFHKKDHLIAAQAFYDKHGRKTIILARFMPILPRTFAPTSSPAWAG